MTTSTHALKFDHRSDDRLNTDVEGIRARIVDTMRQIRRGADLDRIRPVVDIFLEPLDQTGLQQLEKALETRTSGDLALIARELLSVAFASNDCAPANIPELRAIDPDDEIDVDVDPGPTHG